MINQKLISFKVDESQLAILDEFILNYEFCRLNRNKLINYLLKFGLDTLLLQRSICPKRPCGLLLDY